MTNKEKFKEVFGLEMDDTSDCGFFDCSDRDCYECPVKDTKDWWNAEYKEPTTTNDLAVAEMIRLVRESDVIDRTDGSVLAKAFNYLFDRYIEEPTTKNDLGVDAVSRQAVIDLMMQKWGENFSGDDAMQESIDAIRELPSVTPQEPRWIPVSEGLPDIHNYSENYFVTLKRGGVHIAMFTECNGKHWWTYDDVKAWMPLPKPFEPQESENT